MPLGTEVGLSPGDIMLDGDPAPPTERGTAAPPALSVHVALAPSPISATAELLLQSPAIAEDCYILVVFLFLFFSVHQIFDVPGPIFAKLCHTTRYVLK